jgi:hypothetical protein
MKDWVFNSIVAAIVLAAIVVIGYMAYDSSRDRRIVVEGTITAIQDTFWQGAWTVIQQPNGLSIKVSGVWGYQGQKVKVKADEVQ